ncbi:MAG: ABC transporter permease [Candidatus Saccharimonadales bacterium]|nr:ABC transporter permease [Candidatus Saccharimonadales bacterium]
MSSKSKTPGLVKEMTKAFTKRYLRSKVALFFTIAFPLIFLVIFGGIFGSDNGPNFNLAILNESETEFASGFVQQAEQNEIFTLSDIEGFEDAKEKMGRGEVDAIIKLPQQFGVIDELGRPSGSLELFYDESDQTLATTTISVLQGVIDAINDEFVQVEPPLSLNAQPIQTANLSSFDYIFAGLVGYSILGLGIFSMANGFTSDKKTGSLRRIRVAPIKAWQLIVATAFSRIVVGYITVAIMFVTGLVVFGFDMRGDYFNFALFTLISIICMFGFGMAIAGWARDDNQAAPITNLVAFPMMFLSGVFFPRFLMPDWLQGITDYVPLTPIIDGLRKILTEAQTILDLGPELAIIGAWTLIIYFISAKTFRWE